MKRPFVLALLLLLILDVFIFHAPAIAQASPQPAAPAQTPQPAMAAQAAQSPGFDAAMKLYRRRHYAEAIQAFDAVLQAEPGNAAASYFKGYAQYVTRHYSDSLASFGQAFAADPSFNPRPYFHSR